MQTATARKEQEGKQRPSQAVDGAIVKPFGNGRTASKETDLRFCVRCEVFSEALEENETLEDLDASSNGIGSSPILDIQTFRMLSS